MQVTLTSQSANAACQVFAEWAPNDGPLAQGHACPAEGATISPVFIMPATGTPVPKQEAIWVAIIKAFSSYVYGVDAAGTPNSPMPVADLDIMPGKLVVKQVDGRPRLVYAILEVGRKPGSSVTAADAGCLPWV